MGTLAPPDLEPPQLNSVVLGQRKTTGGRSRPSGNRPPEETQYIPNTDVTSSQRAETNELALGQLERLVPQDKARPTVRTRTAPEGSRSTLKPETARREHWFSSSLGVKKKDF